MLAKALGVTAAEALTLLKERYDGYHFAHDSPDVYNRFSLLIALDDGRLDDYWFGTGTPTALVEMIRRSDLTSEELAEGTVRATASSFDAPTEEMATLVPFMYQSGYLTIKSYSQRLRLYNLGIPNEEVRTGLFEVLLPAYTGLDDRRGGVLVEELVESLDAGDLEWFFDLLRSFFAGMDRRIAVKSERDLEPTVYIVMTLVGAFVRCQVSTAQGRADTVLEGPGGRLRSRAQVLPRGAPRDGRAGPGPGA